MEKTWGERRGSNPRHLGPQPSALPAELRPPCAVQGATLPAKDRNEETDFVQAQKVMISR